MTFRLFASHLAVAVTAMGATAAAHALEFEGSGFASLVAGRSAGACADQPTIGGAFAGGCTRFVADWAHAGVYEPHWSARPESRLGLQGTARASDQLSATGQVVARGVDGKAAVEWAYLTWQPSSDWTVSAGRKRLPLFYFSDFQDVGYAYTWLRPPTDVYGWDIVNYNGASARYQTMLGGYSLKADLFGGSETSRDNAYSTLMFTNQPKDVMWKNIRGAALEAGRGWLSLRGVVIQNDYQERDRTSGTLDVLNSGRTTGKQTIYGLSANVDADPFLLRSEYSVFDRSDFQYEARAWLLAAGWRLGKFTPMATLSGYRETTPFSNYAPLAMRSAALTLRYELGTNTALKAQLDRYTDRSPSGIFAGSSRLLGVGLDTVF